MRKWLPIVLELLYPVVPIIKGGHADYAFHETDLRINYAHGYRALAIDEHRAAFVPMIGGELS